MPPGSNMQWQPVFQEAAPQLGQPENPGGAVPATPQFGAPDHLSTPGQPAPQLGAPDRFSAPGQPAQQLGVPEHFGGPGSAAGVEYFGGAGSAGSQFGGGGPHATGWGMPVAAPPGGVHFDRPQPGGRRAWIGIAVAVLVLSGGAAVVALHDGDTKAAAADAPGMVSALSTKANPAAKSKTATSTAAPSAEQPKVPGYQVVIAPDSGAAYDVPADWTVAAPEVTGKFGAPPDTVMGKGMASEGRDYCPGSTRTVSLLTGSDSTDSTSAALELGAKAARAYSSGANPGPPQPLTSYDGSQNGVFVETRGTIANPNPGCAAEYSVYTFATPAEQGSFVMVIAADIGVPKAVDPDTAKRIFASVRPHGD
ncbi:hypothetical protein ACFVMC_04600 [Nocardia sp. NPDC127579]|uniref:hypothetical protein n=1 Tax=Nocardia sp. NPDC127579 TaxID=3345402 RepID=UPI003625017F